MMTAALSALLDHYPDAEFTLLTSADGKRVLSDSHERIKDIWLYDRKHPFPFVIRRSLKQAISMADFDYIYNFESNPSYGRLLKDSSAKIHAISTSKASKAKHFAQRLIDVVSEGVGKNVGFYPLYLPVKKQYEEYNRELLGKSGITDKTLLIAFHPTFSGFHSRRKVKTIGKHKLWPHENFSMLADRLSRYGKEKGIEMEIVLNLMPDELEIGQDIVAGSKSRPIIISPKPNMKNYIAFLKRVDLLVVPDTGPMHMAAAVGTHLVALFSGKNPEDCGPFMNPGGYSVLRAEETDSPEKGIAAISVDAVYRACIDQIKMLRGTSG